MKSKSKMDGFINRLKKYGDIASYNRYHPINSVFLNMLGSCYNRNFYDFNDVGSKGVNVFRIWRFSFREFCKWARCNGYSDGMVLARKDKFKNFTPSNCYFKNKVDKK